MKTLIENKIDTIYECIADKELGFGTKVWVKGQGFLTIAQEGWGVRLNRHGKLERRRTCPRRVGEEYYKVIGNLF